MDHFKHPFFLKYITICDKHFQLKQAKDDSLVEYERLIFWVRNL